MARRGISCAAIEPAVVMDFAFWLITSSQGSATVTPSPLRKVRRAMRQWFVWMFMGVVLGSWLFEHAIQKLAILLRHRFPLNRHAGQFLAQFLDVIGWDIQ